MISSILNHLSGFLDIYPPSLKELNDSLSINVRDPEPDSGAPLSKPAAKSILKPHFVPVLHWDCVTELNSVYDISSIHYSMVQAVKPGQCPEFGDYAFALENLSEKSFIHPKGTLFIFDPEQVYCDGDTVLVRMKNTRKLTLKEVMITPTDIILKSIYHGPNTPLIYNENKHEILAATVFTMSGSRYNEFFKEDMDIIQCKTDEEISKTFSVMSQLRDVDEKTYSGIIKNLMNHGYYLVGIFDKLKQCKGILGYEVRTRLHTKKMIYITDLVVDENHRSQKHGEALIDWVKREAFYIDCQSVVLDSGVDCLKAHKFYLRNEFKNTSLNFKYYP